MLSKQTGTPPINPPPPKANLSTHPDKLGCYPNKRVHLPLTLPHPRPTCPPRQAGVLSKQTGTPPINPPPPKANLSTHPDKLGCYPNKRVHLPLTLPHPRPTCPPRQAGVLSKQTGTPPINPPPPKANLSTHPDKLGCYPNKRVHLPLTLPHPRPTCPPTQTSWGVIQTNGYTSH